MPQREPIRANQKVGEIVEAFPESRRVFEILGIDYCCGTGKAIGTAAQAAGVDLEELDLLVRDEDGSPLHPAQTPSDFSGRSLTLQIDHLIGHHHRYARRQLLRLDRVLRRVSSGHRKLKDLGRLRALLDELLADLIPHMAREERYLFPYMRSLEGTMRPDDRITVPVFGNLQYPLASITHDHEDDSNRLMELRSLTSGFRPDEGACSAVHQLYRGLAELERDLQEHIRIENQIVFPRAVELERTARNEATSSGS